MAWCRNSFSPSGPRPSSPSVRTPLRPADKLYLPNEKICLTKFFYPAYQALLGSELHAGSLPCCGAPVPDGIQFVLVDPIARAIFEPAPAARQQEGVAALRTQHDVHPVCACVNMHAIVCMHACASVCLCAFSLSRARSTAVARLVLCRHRCPRPSAWSSCSSS